MLLAQETLEEDSISRLINGYQEDKMDILSNTPNTMAMNMEGARKK